MLNYWQIGISPWMEQMMEKSTLNILLFSMLDALSTLWMTLMLMQERPKERINDKAGIR